MAPCHVSRPALHQTQILAVEALRILVSELEAFDHTPVIDIRPVSVTVKPEESTPEG